MKNKVLVKIYVPEVNAEYDIFIPVNEYVWKIKKIIMSTVSDLASRACNPNENYSLINVKTGKIYSDNSIIYNTEIRNTTELVLTVNNSNNN